MQRGDALGWRLSPEFMTAPPRASFFEGYRYAIPSFS
jgi:hypothetical protein